MDIQDAYFHLPVHPAFRKYLRFCYKGALFQFSAMPFGLSVAPYIWTKVMRPVVKYLRAKGIRNVVCYDDLIFMHQGSDQCHQNMIIVQQLFSNLGLTPHPTKCSLTPSHRIEFLGIVVNSWTMEFMIPEGKCKSIMKDVKDILRLNKLGHLTPRRLASCVGRLLSVTEALIPSRLQTRFTLFQLKHYLRARDWDALVPPLTSITITELEWWLGEFRKFNGRPIRTLPAQITACSDASESGWGAHLTVGHHPQIQTHGFWTGAERQLSNNTRETLAILYGIRSFTHQLTGRVVVWKTDNLVARAYIMNMGGKHLHLTRLVKDLWVDLFKYNITLIVEYIPGVENTQADYLSRISKDSQDWKLLPHYFQQAEAQFCRRHTIDLFATLQNRQVPRFCSARPQPGAVALNAFTLDWSREVAWANPPFSLVGRVLGKVRELRCSLTLVAPVWQSQAWWPLLLAQVRDFILIPPNQPLFAPGQSGGQSYPPPPWPVIVCLISGKHTRHSHCRDRLRRQLYLLGHNHP
eukprot:TRINITY_DN2599_c0_g1::TRINITY_DN2599_c0_g1_i1::g.19278::m.19278 TRINITY_DN2599_c0_g1::TRINITY_DN2599_c0_g1_i1::g.19278  ORF type:complete len:569 (-),score=-40.00,sp/Q99315/YG31B_YEAST/23.17/3e-12,RVT_1/PF00078.22/4.5e-18,Dam/PF05869.6/2.1e-06,RVT_3/PF13456.1/0.029 TRINITY_DN2599_c0_g1_i1:675-2240(-)